MNSFSDYLAHGNAWLYIPAAVLLGALHGLEPGHSKTIMAAFIVAIRGTVKQAVLLGLAATVSHTAIIWVLAPIGLYYSGHFNVEKLEPYFQVVAGLIIIGMGTIMFFVLFQKGGPLSAVPMILAGGAALMAIVGILFFKESASAPRLLGIVLALVGLYLLRL